MPWLVSKLIKLKESLSFIHSVHMVAVPAYALHLFLSIHFFVSWFSPLLSNGLQRATQPLMVTRGAFRRWLTLHYLIMCTLQHLSDIIMNE